MDVTGNRRADDPEMRHVMEDAPLASKLPADEP
jgi:hypothetical protein